MSKILKSQLVSILLVVILNLLNQASLGEAQDDPGDPLFLTPLIKSGETVQAREAALVRETFLPLVSYSGFITINETYNSNLFFWYFPTEDVQNDDAPVVLFSDGGPGFSCIFSVFNYGPYFGNDADGSFSLNPFSWHKKFHMIFLDNPVDVGFSFTENEDGHVYTSDQAAVGIYEFLTQFFQMFPHLQKNKFYNAGGSYGGTYAVEIATLIHKHNMADPEVHINLQGILADSPYFEGYTQTLFGDVFFHAGLINAKALEVYHEKEKHIKDLILEEKYGEAFVSWQELGLLTTIELTGYNALYDMLDENIRYKDMTILVTKNSTRRALHVGSQKFLFQSEAVQGRMNPNLLRSVKSKLEALLQAGYRVLMYVGTMDVITGPIGMQIFLSTLNWEYAGELIDGPRDIWKDDKGIVGYVTRAGNSSTYAVVRNAGHGVAIYFHERAFNLVAKFVEESGLIE